MTSLDEAVCRRCPRQFGIAIAFVMRSSGGGWWWRRDPVGWKRVNAGTDTYMYMHSKKTTETPNADDPRSRSGETCAYFDGS